MKKKKKCPRCQQSKPFAEFSKNRAKLDGLQSYCQVCARAKYSENPKHHMQFVRTWQKANPDRMREYNRRQGIRDHGISLQVFNQMLADQKATCAICGNPQTNGRRLAIDHDHSCCPSRNSCGKCIRGLLCDRCNRMIGLVGDNVQTLQAAISYLQEFPFRRLSAST